MAIGEEEAQNSTGYLWDVSTEVFAPEHLAADEAAAEQAPQQERGPHRWPSIQLQATPNSA